MYHGSDSGHVMVHCNNKVILIDFNVLRPKTYHFFIEDELCELAIEQEGSGYSYDLSINKKADTHKNRHRQVVDRWEKRRMLIGGGIVFFLLLFWALLFMRGLLN